MSLGGFRYGASGRAWGNRLVSASDHLVVAEGAAGQGHDLRGNLTGGEIRCMAGAVNGAGLRVPAADGVTLVRNQASRIILGQMDVGFTLDAGLGAAVDGARAYANSVALTRDQVDVGSLDEDLSDAHGLPAPLPTAVLADTEVGPNISVTPRSITAAADSATLTTADATVDLNVLANDASVPAGSALKITSDDLRLVSGAGGSGACTAQVINGGVQTSNNVRIARNSQGVSTVKLQYRPRFADSSYVHPSWVDINVAIRSDALSSAYNYTYKYPAVATLDVSRIIPWRLGTAVPAHNVGDTILAYGDAAAMTGSGYGGKGFRGSIVLIGATFEPTASLYGQLSQNNPYKPYRGINNIMNFNFDEDARHHDTWEVEPGLWVDWPIIYLANVGVSFEKNAANFGDIIRASHAGSRPLNTTTKALVGTKCIIFENKLKLFRGPHYADDQVNSDGTPIRDAAGKIIGQNAFHSDGIQPQRHPDYKTKPYRSGVVGWRIADSYFNWIMGQAFFCGLVPEVEGFPRTVRQRYANVAWEHASPWGPKPAGSYCPNPDDFSEGDLVKSPRMIMNYEGGFGEGNTGELTDYDNGKYWAVRFDDNCWIKSKWLLNEKEGGRFLVARYLNAPGGLTYPKSGTSGTYVFAPDVKPTHTFPAWAAAAGKAVTLMDKNQTLPETCPDNHVGHGLRITTAADAAAILKA